MAESLVGLLRAGRDRVPDRPWLSTPRDVLTRAQAWQLASRTAGGLVDAGLEPGDRIALFCRNGSEFVLTWLAAQMIGVGVVPVNTGFRADEAGYVLRHSGARAVLVDAVTAPVVAQALAQNQATGVELVLTLDGTADTADAVQPAPVRTIPLSRLITATALPAAEHVKPSDDDIASVLYTSGTTGPPKGCLLGHDYFELGARAVVDQLRLGSEDVMLCVLPLFHMNAQVSSVTASLCSDAALVLEDRFSASQFLDVVRTHGVTEFSYLGVISAALAKQPASARDRDHRLRVGFGAGMPAALHADFENRFGVSMLEVFGMTETGMDLATQLVPDRRVGRRSLGTVVPGKHVRIVGDDGAVLGPDEPGHLQVRGPGLFRGYLDDPDATAAAFDGPWFRTGDLAQYDADGWFYYVDRFKDIVRRAGENIGSVEVETVLTAHPAVTAAAVIGVDDDVVGQEVKAVLVLQPGETPSAELYEAILAHCAERLASFKVPRYLQAVDDVPRTASQKIRKADIRAAYASAEGAYERTWKAAAHLGIGERWPPS